MFSVQRQCGQSQSNNRHQEKSHIICAYTVIVIVFIVIYSAHIYLYAYIFYILPSNPDVIWVILNALPQWVAELLGGESAYNQRIQALQEQPTFLREPQRGVLLHINNI